MKSILKNLKTLSVGLFVLFFVAGMSMTSCTAKTGAEAGDDPPVEEAADSEEHPSDDSGDEHPSDTTESEHPSDSDGGEHPSDDEEES